MLECFQPGAGAPEDPARAAEVLARVGDGRVLACAGCQRHITTPAARIAVAGTHEHTCTNPHGYRYRIGCFAVAEGLVALGNPSSFWSWFPGYEWQVQQCGACRRLLGWLFASPDSRFYGLILDELVELDLGS